MLIRLTLIFLSMLCEPFLIGMDLDEKDREAAYLLAILSCDFNYVLDNNCYCQCHKEEKFNHPSIKKKRNRHQYSREELSILEEEFKKNKIPSKQRLIEILAEIGNSELTIRNIQIWFQNRRTKEKRQKENY